MIGARDMAFPRLNAFSYWVFLFSGIFIYSSFLIGKAPNGGWFAYTPLTDQTYSPGINLDFWGLGVIFVGISSSAGAVNFIVTAFKMRTPGMTVNRMPMFVWSLIGMAFMIVFAFPAVTVSAALLEADRLFNTAFFVPAHGGSVLLYQHLFWFWGHPEVYILFLPATGMISMIIPVFSRRPLAGYLWVAASLVAIAFISFGVWVHHMFATGVPAQAMGFFSAASLVIALPSAIQYFAWIGTMWGGRRPTGAADALRVRLPRHLPHRRHHRGHGGCHARRPPGDGQLLHRGPLPLRAQRRRRLPDLRRARTTGSRR